MKTMITPLALGTCLMLLMAPSCQKQNEARGKMGHEQYVLQTDGQPVILEMANDGENVYMRIAGTENGPTSFAVIQSTNCDSVRGLWQNDATALSISSLVTLRRDTTWTVYGTPKPKCLCVLMVDNDTLSINDPHYIPRDVPSGNLSAGQTGGNGQNAVKYCVR